MIARLGRPSRQWQAWVDALDDIGYKIDWVGLLAMELQRFRVRRGDVVVLDGMLPNITRFIQRINSQDKDTCIIVAAEVEDPKIEHDVKLLKGVFYISGPMPAEHFAEAIKKAVSQEMVA